MPNKENGKSAIEKAVETVIIAGSEAPANAPRAAITPRINPPVPIELGGKIRTLRMDFKAMRMIQNATGLVMWRSEAWDTDNIDPIKMATILWASLLHESPDLTLEEVEVMDGMELSNFTYLTDRIGALWGSIMPEPDDNTVDENTDPNVVPASQSITG